jgi:hypothetical protein
MDPLPIIALVTIATLFGLAWHDEPSRTESSISGDDAALSKVGVDWVMVVVWSFVVVSFAALFVASYVIWAKCHGR